MNFPVFVSRWASGNKFPFSSLSSVIVLNFITLKSLPFFPGLVCVKTTSAPLLATASKTATAAITGDKTTMATIARQQSIILLKQFLYITPSFLNTETTIYSAKL